MVVFRIHRTDSHSSDHCNAQIRPIHQRNGVHEPKRWDQAEIDPADDLLLLLGREGIDVGLIGEMRFLRDSLLEVAHLRALLVLYGCHLDDDAAVQQLLKKN